MQAPCRAEERSSPGSYRVRATATNRSEESRAVEVPESGQARVYVAMEPMEKTG